MMLTLVLIRTHQKFTQADTLTVCETGCACGTAYVRSAASTTPPSADDSWSNTIGVAPPTIPLRASGWYEPPLPFVTRTSDRLCALNRIAEVGLALCFKLFHKLAFKIRFRLWRWCRL